MFRTRKQGSKEKNVDRKERNGTQPARRSAGMNGTVVIYGPVMITLLRIYSIDRPYVIRLEL